MKALFGHASRDTTMQNLDEFGRPLPDAKRYPSGMKALSTKVRALGHGGVRRACALGTS